MPADHSVEPAFVRVHAHGVLSIDQLRSVCRRLGADALVSALPAPLVLVDLREVERFRFSGAELRSFAAGCARTTGQRPGVRIAIVVACDEGYGLARMYELSRERGTEEVRAFRADEDALDWLGVEPSDDTATPAISPR